MNLPEAAALIYKAVDANLEEARVLSPDMGGTAGTEVSQEIVLAALHHVAVPKHLSLPWRSSSAAVGGGTAMRPWNLS